MPQYASASKMTPTLILLQLLSVLHPVGGFVRWGLESRSARVMALDASLVEQLSGEPSLTTFYSLLEGLPDLKTLMADESIGSGDGNIFTIFAPTNDAFKKLTKDQAFKLGKKENLSILRKLIRYHVHEDVLSKEDILEMRELSTLALLPITVKLVDGGKDFRLNEAKVIRELELSGNGRIFEMDNLVNPVLLYRFMV